MEMKALILHERHTASRSANSFRKMMVLLSLLLLCILNATAQVTVSGSTAAVNGSYTTLKLAFDKINANAAQSGNNIQIAISASINDNNTARLNSGNWATLTIYPTTTGIILSGSIAAPLIDLSGADYVTIDGRVNGTDAPKALTIVNSSTGSTDGTSTIRLINDATNNAIQYCVLKGAATSSNKIGIIYFATGTSAGNSNNLIDNNSLTGISSTVRPNKVIYSFGTSAAVRNITNTISNNLFYDYIYWGSPSKGIYIDSYNNGWTITDNSFYETTTNTQTSLSAIAIQIQPSVSGNPSGNNYTITNNYIGGNAPQAAGMWSQSFTSFNSFLGIFCVLSENSAQVTIQGNVIRNMSINSTDLYFQGISFSTIGVNSAIVSDNIVGSTTSTGSITLNAASSSQIAYVIPIVVSSGSSTGTAVCRNNSMGGITVSNTSASIQTEFRGIDARGSLTASNNIVGSTTVSNSINISSAASTIAQSVVGIYLVPLSYSPSNAINNTIANLKATSPYASSVTAGMLIDCVNGQTQSAMVSSNFIYNINANNGTQYGIRTTYDNNIGSAVNTYIQNNVINLTNNTSTCSSRGIDYFGKCSGSVNAYYNTVYLGGTCTTGTLNSYALYSTVTTGTSDFRNNLLVNKRANSGATGKHYAISVTSVPTTIDNNDYVVNTASGGVTGYLTSDRATLGDWQGATGKDVWSLDVDPDFATAGGTNATDYIPGNTYLYGAKVTGITTDYAGATRGTTPTMGAFEIALDLQVEVWKGGALQGGYVNLGTAFTDINTGVHTGALDVKIKANTNETASAVLNASGSGSASYTAINIYPTTSVLSVTGNLSSPLINLNGADNVTLDGRVDGNTGSAPDLTIANTSASAATIQFIGDASNNTVRYCTLKGSSTVSTEGVIFFSTGTTTGNDNNAITYNNITNNGGSRPYNTIYSVGSSAAIMNTGNTVSNNQFYNFLSRAGTSFGINLGNYNSDWTISGNSFYDNELPTFIPTAAGTYYIIYVNYNLGNNFTISGNYIGGRDANCGGTAWTKTNAYDNPFYGINLNCGTTTASTVTGNIIRNISWSNSGAGAWYGISAGGSVNVGTTSGTGNTVGGSVTYSARATNSSFHGILTSTSGTNSVNYNTVSGISCSNSPVTNVQSVSGLRFIGTSALTVNNNTIANITNNSTAATSTTTAMSYSGGTTLSTVSGNFIYSISAGSGSILYGINKTAGKVTFSNNIITLGNNTPNVLYGIYETGAATNNTNLYFNTVYLGGSPTTTTNKSYALYSAVTTNPRDFRNNLFINARSTTVASSNQHYAAYYNYSVTTNLTYNDYNDYYVSGTGGTLGYYGAVNKTTLPIVTGKDVNSQKVDPIFATAGGTLAKNYAPGASVIVGVSGTGIATDYFGVITSRPIPTMGAIEQTLPTVSTQAVINIFTASATGNGTIEALGMPETILEYGVCWSNTNATPTVANYRVNNGTISSIGPFIAAMSLAPGTKYYVRAYASNVVGRYFYGGTVTFVTLPPLIYTIP